MPLSQPGGATAPADIDIPSLPLRTPPDPTDTFITSPLDALPNEKTTRAALHTLESGEEFAGIVLGSPTITGLGGTFAVCNIRPLGIDLNTGIIAGADHMFVIAGGQLGQTWREVSDQVITTWSAERDITASTTQTQAGGTLMESSYNIITVVANIDDTVTLPSASTTAAAGRQMCIINEGANRLQIFPSAGQDLGQGDNIPTTLAVGRTAWFFAISSVGGSKRWTTILPALETGKVVQTVFVQDGSVSTTSAIIDDDDTIPQQTEGGEKLTLSITPLNAANILEVTTVIIGSSSSTTRTTVALFRDATADAVAAALMRTETEDEVNLIIKHREVAGSTAATTFKVRAGPSSGGTTWTFNGVTGTRKLGGVLATFLLIKEIQP